MIDGSRTIQVSFPDEQQQFHYFLEKIFNWYSTNELDNLHDIDLGSLI